MGQQEKQREEQKSARKQNSVVVSYDAPFRGFVNMSLNAAEKSAYDDWILTNDCWTVHDATLRDGVVLSVKWVEKDKGFLASATQRRSTSPNAGLVVTARSTESPKALMRLLFILRLLSDKPRWEDTQEVADPDRW